MSKMSTRPRVLEEIRSALHSEPRFGPEGEVGLDFDAGTLTIAGEARSIAVRKRLLELAAAHPEVVHVVDRLRVAPTRRMGDGEIRDHVRDVLLGEPALAELALREIAKGRISTVREPPDRRRGEIRISVEEGVVTLDGTAPSLAHKRLAGVLAWWVPGSRDVINGLEVSPPEQDNDAEITDAVRLALEKDPFVDANQIRVTTEGRIVTLEGIVAKEGEREMAESDAWYVFGIDGVQNWLEVRPVEPTGSS
jgi:osmotically-inducible protein OsmY